MGGWVMFNCTKLKLDFPKTLILFSLKRSSHFSKLFRFKSNMVPWTKGTLHLRTGQQTIATD